MRDFVAADPVKQAGVCPFGLPDLYGVTELFLTVAESVDSDY
jgi:hypothetical protein